MFKKKKQIDPVMNFTTKKEQARKRRRKQIFSFIMIGLTLIGMIVTALTVLTSKSINPIEESRVSTIQSETPETIKSLLDNSYNSKAKSIEEQELEKKQEEEKRKKDALLQEEKSKQEDAFNKSVNDKVSEIEKQYKDQLSNASSNLEKANSQISELTDTNKKLVSENEDLTKQIESLKKQIVSQGGSHD